MAQYFRELRQESPLLQVEWLDEAMEPGRARALGVSRNGVVVLSRGERHELYTVGLDLDLARDQLMLLDRGESAAAHADAAEARALRHRGPWRARGCAAEAGGEPPPENLTAFKVFLRAQNLEVRNLGLAEGLGKEVPPDAALVFIPAPTKELLPAEVAALREYLDRGGRPWLALEPEGPAHDALLEPLGLKYVNTPLTNEQMFLCVRHQQSDHANLGSAFYSSHPSVSTLASLEAQAPVLFPGTGTFAPRGSPPAGVSHDLSVRARVVMGDVDALADGVLRNVGNSHLALGTLRWLTGDESISDTVSNEEDVPIQHTREQDVVWFYATVLLAPVMVLGVGFFSTRRRGRRAPAVPEGGAR